MSKFRQTDLVRTFAVTFHSPREFSYRARGWDQLIYAVRGVITVQSARDCWVLPAHRGLWVPNEAEARIDIPGPASLRSLYLRKGVVRLEPRRCTVIHVSPLLRELILYTIHAGVLDASVAEQKHVAAVLADQLRTVRTAPLELSMPSDARAQRAANLMRADPSSADMQTIARTAGASVRTLERLFREETAMPLGAWRRRMRILHALECLAAGNTVTETALTNGYESVSAFVAMFRKELGVTPARYFAQP